MRAKIEKWLTTAWYAPTFHLSLLPLLPFSWLFRAIVTLRRFLYKKHILNSYRSTLPIIVVGNLTVGGTGKTPFVIHLYHLLKTHGIQAGIVLRGVGSNKNDSIFCVTKESNVKEVGDEALVLANETNAPIVIAKNRVSAVKELESQQLCDVIISDDGLQHYHLQRDLEILLVDAKRQFGNQRLLPAGPLREPMSRLNQVDFVIENGRKTDRHAYSMRYQAIEFVSVANPTIKQSLANFAGKTVHAVTGIGNPLQFFTLLTQLQLTPITHVFKDHHPYNIADLQFNDTLPIVMTEKDAVKCHGFARDNMWYLAVTLVVDEPLATDLWKKISALMES